MQSYSVYFIVRTTATLKSNFNINLAVTRISNQHLLPTAGQCLKVFLLPPHLSSSAQSDRIAGEVDSSPTEYISYNKFLY